MGSGSVVKGGRDGTRKGKARQMRNVECKEVEEKRKNRSIVNC